MNAGVTVRETMVREYVGVSEGDSALETAKLLLEDGDGCAVVLRGHEAVGLIREQDLLGAAVDTDGLDDVTAADVMLSPVPTIDVTDGLDAAADALAASDTRWLVAVDGGDPVGVLSEHDLVTAGVFAPGREEFTQNETGPLDADRTVDATLATVGTVSEDELVREDGGAATTSTQSVCEACGSLRRDLLSVQGQLLCPDCRDV